MISKKVIGIAILMVSILTSTIAITTVNACLLPGYSPGYWKHQCKAYIDGRGRLQETGIVDLAHDIGKTVKEAYDIFTDPSKNSLWLGLANQFNAAAGLAPYVE